jgi:hypothetical protein
MELICKECGNVALLGNRKSILLDTTITTPLFIEGVLNEIRHKVQEMRKKAGYDINDKIILCCDCADKLNLDFIRKDILADAIFPHIADGCDLEDNIYDINLGIKKYPKLSNNIKKKWKKKKKTKNWRAFKECLKKWKNGDMAG